MIDWKIRKILRNIKKNNPQKRLEAIEQLIHYKQQTDLQIQLDTLKDIIKVAASKFPEPVAEWDNPSYYLTDFVCDYIVPVTIDGLMKHFDDLHIHAQQRAIQTLLSTEDEEVFFFLENKLIDLIEKDRMEIPTSEITRYPVLAKAIVEKTIHKLTTPEYKFSLYELLLAINTSGYGQGFKKELVIPILLEDYVQEKQSYLKYDKDYSMKFVYTSWKDSFYVVRNRMILYIRLMAFYFTEKVEHELKLMLSFQDPFIRLHALFVCIAKNLPYDKELLIDCASNIETAEMTYWKLISQNLEHLYPYPDEAQFFLAKTRLFFTLINGAEDEPVFPEDIQIIDEVGLKTLHGQWAKYYLITFKNYETVYVGWAGGFLETEDNSFEMLNGTFSNFVKFDSMSIEEHKQAFLQQETESRDAYKDEVHYESSPKLSNVVYFFIFPVVAKWIQIATGSGTSIPLTIIATVILATYIVYNTAINKHRKVTISGQQLIKKDGSKLLSIPMHEIKRVKRNNKTITIYGQDDQIIMEVPIRWVNYDVFSLQLKQHTSFLLNPPFIQQ